jgi:hypothetical protein
VCDVLVREGAEGHRVWQVDGAEEFRTASRRGKLLLLLLEGSTGSPSATVSGRGCVDERRLWVANSDADIGVHVVQVIVAVIVDGAEMKPWVVGSSESFNDRVQFARAGVLPGGATELSFPTENMSVVIIVGPILITDQQACLSRRLSIVSAIIRISQEDFRWKMLIISISQVLTKSSSRSVSSCCTSYCLLAFYSY